jgi:type I restriction-modification system DNA methylase subunit
MIERSKDRIKQTGEVFTPLELVDEILGKLPVELFKDPKKTFIDPACGDGNFLVRVVAWKIHHGSTPKQALKTTYGVDIMPDNIRHCKERLLMVADEHDDDIFGMADARKKYGKIVDRNIVCADALKEWDFENWRRKTDIVDDLLEF